MPRGRVERKEFSITCGGGNGNAWAEAAATPNSRDSTSHAGSRVIKSHLLTPNHSTLLCHVKATAQFTEMLEFFSLLS